MNVLNKKGQNMAEYSILIALVVAAAIGIKVYVQRGVQARMHDESDKIGTEIKNNMATAGLGSGVVANLEKQYEDTKFSKQTTSNTVEDTTKYTMNKAGTTSTEIRKSTAGGVGDNETYQRPSN